MVFEWVSGVCWKVADLGVGRVLEVVQDVCRKGVGCFGGGGVEMTGVESHAVRFKVVLSSCAYCAGWVTSSHWDYSQLNTPPQATGRVAQQNLPLSTRIWTSAWAWFRRRDTWTSDMTRQRSQRSLRLEPLGSDTGRGIFLTSCGAELADEAHLDVESTAQYRHLHRTQEGHPRTSRTCRPREMKMLASRRGSNSSPVVLEHVSVPSTLEASSPLRALGQSKCACVL